MKAVRIKLYDYMVRNNLDLVISLQEESKVSTYLRERLASIEPQVKQWWEDGTPAYIVEERCLEELTKTLRPSKFNYIRSILEEEFEEECARLQESGVLTYEIMNLIESCSSVFEELGFSEANEDDRYLRYAVTGQIKEYLGGPAGPAIEERRKM